MADPVPLQVVQPPPNPVPDAGWNLRSVASKGGVIGIVLGCLLGFLVLNLAMLFLEQKTYLLRLAYAGSSIGIGALLVAGIGFLLVCTLVWPTRFDESWGRLEKILISGAFYFFAGLALLLYAIHTTSSQTHPSLTFLIAMLGMAIMLFGTGSQAVGSIATAGAALPTPKQAFEKDPAKLAEQDSQADKVQASVRATIEAIKSAESLPTEAEKAAALAAIRESAEATEKLTAELPAEAPPAPTPDWHPVKANAAIAGGAAVLTAIFGWGVIHYRTDIKDVFGYYDRYVKVRIDACAASDKTCVSSGNSESTAEINNFKLADYSVDAELVNGSPIYIVQGGNEIQFLLFADAFDQNIPIKLRVYRKTDNPNVINAIDQNIDLTLWPEIIDKESRRVVAAKALGTTKPDTKDAEPDTKDAEPDTEGTEPDPEDATIEQCKQSSDNHPVDCALALEGASYRGDRLSTVLYSLNFYRQETTVPIEAKVKTEVGDVTLKLE